MWQLLLQIRSPLRDGFSRLLSRTVASMYAQRLLLAWICDSCRAVAAPRPAWAMIGSEARLGKKSFPERTSPTGPGVCPSNVTQPAWARIRTANVPPPHRARGVPNTPSEKRHLSSLFMVHGKLQDKQTTKQRKCWVKLQLAIFSPAKCSAQTGRV